MYHVGSKVRIGTLPEVSWPNSRAPNSSSGVSVQQSVGSSSSRETCVPGQDTGVQQGCFFLSLFSCNFDYQLSPNFHRFVIFILLLGHTK